MKEEKNKGRLRIMVLTTGEYSDFCCDHLWVPEETDLDAEVKNHRKWYDEVYLPAHRDWKPRPGESFHIKYLNFIEWLIEHCGAVRAELDHYEY